ncbi:MAG: outer membrane biosynthesis protein TonB [Flavobacteriales bacterium]|jgi:outer membrane biosynthesis protein TonB
MDRHGEVLKKDRKKSALAAFLIFLFILVATIVFTAYSIPNPPPGDTFVEVGMADFGDTSSASGDTESENPSESPQEEVQEETSESASAEAADTQEIVTQESSEAVVESGAAATSTTTTNPKPTPDPKPDPKPSSELSGALGSLGQSGGGPSDGEGEGTGNEGANNGAIDGKGVIDGGDIGWALSGRGLIGKPTVTDNVTDEGVVVLDIYVDRDGKVKRTKRNYGMSSTGNSYLFEISEKAAKKATFSVKPNAPAEQKGQMTFRYKLK